MIPYVTFNQSDWMIYLYASPEEAPVPLFEMDTEQARELITMLVDSIARIERDPDRLELLFAELLTRARNVR